MHSELDYPLELLESDDNPVVVLVAYARDCTGVLYGIASELLAELAVLPALRLRRARFSALVHQHDDVATMLAAAHWSSREAGVPHVPHLYELVSTDPRSTIAAIAELESAWCASPPVQHGVQIEWHGLRHNAAPYCHITSRHDEHGEPIAQILLALPMSAWAQSTTASRCALVRRLLRDLLVRFNAVYGFVDICGQAEAAGGAVHFGDRWVSPCGWSRYCDQVLWRRTRPKGQLIPTRPYWGNYFGHELLQGLDADAVVRAYSSLARDSTSRDWGTAELIGDTALIMTLTSDPMHAVCSVRSMVEGVFEQTIPFLADLLPRLGRPL